jgi:DHA2 family multidrug resistance protein
MTLLAPSRRGPTTAGLMLAMFMISIDTTVVNVCLPQMQASLSAGPDQITWVITSFVLAMAVATPISGWLASRIGLKFMLMGCMVLFTASSLLCGVATSLPAMVLFRVLQGIGGGPMLPLSQTALLNINPPERFGRAMALFSMAAVVSPIIGPVLGAYLTEQLSWRWCFYINLPAGVAAVILLWIFLPAQPVQPRRFDFLGFGSLATALAALQLVLDRGPSQDWLNSGEIVTEATVAVAAFWVFIAHTVTAKSPLFQPEVVRDRNFVAATTVNLFTTMLFVSSLALLPLLMQTVLAYPVMLVGLLSIPRGILMMAILPVIGRLDALVDRRILLGFGLTVIALAFWQMAHFDLSMSPRTIVIASLTQAVGQGVITVPLTTLAMSTIRQELRADAASLSAVIRSAAGAIGVAVLQALNVFNSQRMHAALAAHIHLDDPVVRTGLPAALSPETVQGAMQLNAEITRQAAMVAYADNFRVMAFLAICGTPMLLLLRRPRSQPAATGPVALDAH